MTETDYPYNPNEAIKIAEDRLPMGFSGRYVLSNMRQMKERAEKYDEFTDPESGYERQARRREKLIWNLEKKLEAIKNKLLEWDNIHMRDKHASTAILEDIFKMFLTQSSSRR